MLILPSEKARIPAWTDRILRKGVNIRQTSYNSAPLRFSDHRPVFATFQCTVNIVNEDLRQRISRQLYEQRKAEVGHTAAIIDAEDSEDDEDLIGYDPIEPGLPPASSDQQRWWLENGKMAKSTVAPPKSTQGGSEDSSVVLNPNRPSNPFNATEEPDWVAIPRANSRLSSFSSSISSSPYEHINHSTLLPASTSSPMPRKLPPAFDSSATTPRTSRISLLDEPISETAQKSGPPPPPLPRRKQTKTSSIQQSSTPSTSAAQAVPQASPLAYPMTVSSSSHILAKSSRAPPPIARKPAHLTSTSPTSPSLSDPDFSDAQTPKPQLPRRKTSNISDLTARLEANGAGNLTGGMQKTKSAPTMAGMPSPSIVSTFPTPSISSNGMSLPGLGLDERKPVLPVRSYPQASRPPLPTQPRKPVPIMNQKPTEDLLGADIDTEMHGWETLQPR